MDVPDILVAFDLAAFGFQGDVARTLELAILTISQPCPYQFGHKRLSRDTGSG
jgi:hypothetical protein